MARRHRPAAVDCRVRRRQKVKINLTRAYYSWEEGEDWAEIGLEKQQEQLKCGDNLCWHTHTHTESSDSSLQTFESPDTKCIWRNHIDDESGDFNFKVTPDSNKVCGQQDKHRLLWWDLSNRLLQNDDQRPSLQLKIECSTFRAPTHTHTRRSRWLQQLMMK